MLASELSAISPIVVLISDSPVSSQVVVNLTLNDSASVELVDHGTYRQSAKSLRAQEGNGAFPSRRGLCVVSGRVVQLQQGV